MRDRAASTAVGYVLTLGITLLLVVGLLSVSVTLVEDQRSRAVNAELSVLGNRLAADLASADSMVRAADTPATASVRVALPDRVAGGQYRISIDERADAGGYYRYRLVLESDVADTAVAVHLKTGTEVAETTVSGGSVTVAYDAGSGRLEVAS